MLQVVKLIDHELELFGSVAEPRRPTEAQSRDGMGLDYHYHTFHRSEDRSASKAYVQVNPSLRFGVESSKEIVHLRAFLGLRPCACANTAASRWRLWGACADAIHLPANVSVLFTTCRRQLLASHQRYLVTKDRIGGRLGLM